MTVANVGKPVERIEDQRLLRGRGSYVDDQVREGMLYAAILRSSVPHGRIRGIDTAAARKMPGVHAVITAKDVADRSDGKVPTTPLRLAPMPELVPYEQPVIAQHLVRYVGEPVAVVVAESLALAEDALEAIELDIEPLDPVADWRASREDKVRLHEGHSNVAMTYTASKGDAKTVKAPYVRKEKFRVQRHSAVTMEPRGLLAAWDGATTKMTVSGAAKVPYNTRRVLAKCMDLPEECIEMLEPDVGGGFGVRGEFYPEDFLIPFAARRVNRPVKWTEDRRENLLASNHSREIDVEIEIRCDKDGKVLALLSESWVDMGAYARTSAAVVPRNVAQFLSGPYDIPNIHAQASMMMTNKTPIGTYRGPGRFEADFFRERLFDMAAKDLGIDRVEFRRKNLVRKDQMPYPLATLRPVEKSEELDSGDYNITLDRCLAEIGWKDKLALNGKLVDGVYHGLGIGCFIEGGAAGPKETAKLVLERDGGITVYVGSTNVGQGLETVLLQIAADALEVPMARLRIFHGSTPYLKEGFGSYHSRSTVMGGSAILDAARNLKAKLAAAGKTLESAQGELVEADGEFKNHHHTYAYGAAAAHVTVDPRTGYVKLLEYVTIEDVGRIVNPLLCKGQAIGGAVQGLGGTFLENMVYDEQGQFLTASLADYLMPTASDFPNIKAVTLENSPAPHNPLGVKGGGEGGIVPVGGVVANAVAAALSSLGVEPRELPLSPYKIWQLLHKKSA
ncbi:MAG TPA: xanthine dehydrogenase family protein molybdopterin-binding subunit [Burkholderiales bacterium]|nr:xanthine dehydrogenase family protein molybdopterin-binding subunit [Burkholderiales bacterium]